MSATPDDRTLIDATAFSRMAGVRPVLAGLLPAGEALPFPQRTLLHAGPPLLPGQSPPPPMLNSAAAAIVFEGWAADRAEALALIERGGVAFAAAQDHRCAVPLASVLSPSQQVQVVRDAADAARPAFAPLNGGDGPALRLGLPGPEVVTHLRWLNGPFADALRDPCNAGIELLPIADGALADGDDCHGRTQAATAALFDRLAPVDGTARAFLASSPSFFLNLWMAAVKCMLGAAEGVSRSAVVVALGGNGIDAGLQLAGDPGRWHRIAATVPVGAHASGFDKATALPAIGDSAIVEAFGLGAMAMAHSPAQQQALGAFMPEPAETLAQTLLHAPHPGFALSGARFGLTARAVVRTGKTPVVALGMLDATGRAGRVGGGIWPAPVELFAQAVGAIESQSLPT